MKYIPADNLNYPILITLDDSSKGSGFYLNYHSKELYIVTARHVLYKNTKNKKEEPDNFVLKTKKINVLSYAKDSGEDNSDICEIKLDVLPPENIKYSKTHDVVILKIADLIPKTGTKLFTPKYSNGYSKIKESPGTLVTIVDDYFKKFEDVEISNDAVIFGYPISLGEGIDYEKPLLRKGIVAGKNIQNRTIILDCPVYQGNSGGLVLEIEPTAVNRKSYVIGLVSSFVPFVEIFQSLHFGYKNQGIENSGYSIITPIDVIRELIEELKTSTIKTPNPSKSSQETLPQEK